MKKTIALIFIITALSTNLLHANEDTKTTIQGIVTIENEIVERDSSKSNKVTKKSCSSWCQINGSSKGCYTTFGMCVPIGSICQCKVGNTTRLGSVR